MKFRILIGALVLVIISSCEEISDPTDGIPTTDLFVQYAANTLDTVNVSEGEEAYSWVVQAPISGGEDLITTVSFSGDAVLDTDFSISAVDDFGNDVLLSTSDTEATFTIPFVTANGQAIVTDQSTLTIDFLTDDIIDGNKELLVTLEGAIGSIDSSISFVGGRGPIRKVLVVNIFDAD